MECPTFPDWLFPPVSVREEWALLGAAVLPSCDTCRWKSCLGLLGAGRKPGIGEQWDGVLVAFSVEKYSKGPFSLTANCRINSGRHLCVYLETFITHSLVLQTSGFAWFFFLYSVSEDTSGWLWEGQPGMSSPHYRFWLKHCGAWGDFFAEQLLCRGLCSSRTCRSDSGTLKYKFLGQSVKLWRKAWLRLREKHVAARARVTCQVFWWPPVWGRRMKSQHQWDFQSWIK